MRKYCQDGTGAKTNRKHQSRTMPCHKVNVNLQVVLADMAERLYTEGSNPSLSVHE